MRQTIKCRIHSNIEKELHGPTATCRPQKWPGSLLQTVRATDSGTRLSPLPEPDQGARVYEQSNSLVPKVVTKTAVSVAITWSLAAQGRAPHICRVVSARRQIVVACQEMPERRILCSNG